MLQSLPDGVSVALPAPLLWRTPLASRHPPASQPMTGSGPRGAADGAGMAMPGARTCGADDTLGMGCIISKTGRRGIGDCGGAVRQGSTASRVPSALSRQNGSLA